MAQTSFQERVSAPHQELSSLARLYQLRGREENLGRGLSVSQVYALTALAGDGAMKIGELSEKLSLSLSAMTKLIDGLEDRGLVRRSFLENDRRAVNLRLTAKGQALFQTIHEEFYQHLFDTLEHFSLAELQTITEGLKTLSSSIQAWQDRSKVQAVTRKLGRRTPARTEVSL